jgi:hypothetical protein
VFVSSVYRPDRECLFRGKGVDEEDGLGGHVDTSDSEIGERRRGGWEAKMMSAGKLEGG